MKNKSKYLGTIGEEKAGDFLISLGYEIVENGWRHNKSEIDIIALKDATLIFIEVKSRTNSILPIEELISESQKKRIINAAHYYINFNEIDLNIRFDLIYIEESKKTTKLSHFKEFFVPEID